MMEKRCFLSKGGFSIAETAGLDPSLRWDDKQSRCSFAVTKAAGLDPSVRWDDNSGQNDKKVCCHGTRGMLRGFSLIEVTIVVVLIALLATIAVPTLSSLVGADLRSNTNQLRGLMRETYTSAALSGKQFRIVFLVDKRTYYVEEKRPPESVKTGEVAFKRAKKPLGETRKLPETLRFIEVYTDTMDEPLRKGVATINFFPGGYMEEGHVSLGNLRDPPRVMSLVTQPLTGESVIEDDVPQVKK
jgi:prepilin-type N-terminal cleavage/methylation domain-containing protein